MLFTLNGGSTPASHPETRFTLEGGTVETYNITGTLDIQVSVQTIKVGSVKSQPFLFCKLSIFCNCNLCIEAKHLQQRS